jgi:shikimate dehydrogenase
MTRGGPVAELDGTTTVVGVMGWPVAHSLSPPMHNAAFAALGMNWVYVPCPVQPERIAEALAGIRALGIGGMNVTIPHKAAVAKLVDELSPEARALEAVNTIDNTGDRLTGYNTDGPGFVRSAQEQGVALGGLRVVMIGAGGSARAVALACAREGIAGLTIANRTLERAEGIAALVRRNSDLDAAQATPLGESTQTLIEAADVVINATPVGMHPHQDVPPVIPATWLRPGQVVCDLIYNPRETALLRAAREVGCRTVDGTGMLVHQGAIAFERWTGSEAPVEAMRQALLGALASRAEHARREAEGR